MAATITLEDVKAGFSTTVGDPEILLAIAVVDGSDLCLDANVESADIQKALKLYGVRHILSMQANSGRGEVKSEGAPSGASRSFSGASKNGSPYLDLLKQLDKSGCVVALLENTQRLDMRAIGRRCE